MIEIIFHGRGGQGAVTASIILAHAAWQEGIWSQKIPAYTAERRGAPVKAYLRIDDKPIRRTSFITEPDCVVVLDEGLLEIVDVTDGLKESGVLILNNRAPPSQLELGRRFSKIATVDATEIATKIFGMRPIPLTNTTMLGALGATTNYVKFKSISNAIMSNFPRKIGELNVEAAKEGYEKLKIKESGKEKKNEY